VNDPKLFITMAQRLFSACISTMRAILFCEEFHQKIPQFNQDLDAMFELFKIRTTRRYALNPDYIKLIDDLDTIVNGYKKSSVAFKRKQNYIICDDKYNTNVVSKDKLQDLLKKTEAFIADAEKMVQRMENKL